MSFLLPLRLIGSRLAANVGARLSSLSRLRNITRIRRPRPLVKFHTGQIAPLHEPYARNYYQALKANPLKYADQLTETPLSRLELANFETRRAFIKKPYQMAYTDPKDIAAANERVRVRRATSIFNSPIFKPSNRYINFDPLVEQSFKDAGVNRYWQRPKPNITSSNIFDSLRRRGRAIRRRFNRLRNFDVSSIRNTPTARFVRSLPKRVRYQFSRLMSRREVPAQLEWDDYGAFNNQYPETSSTLTRSPSQLSIPERSNLRRWSTINNLSLPETLQPESRNNFYDRLNSQLDKNEELLSDLRANNLNRSIRNLNERIERSPANLYPSRIPRLVRETPSTSSSRLNAQARQVSRRVKDSISRHTQRMRNSLSQTSQSLKNVENPTRLQRGVRKLRKRGQAFLQYVPLVQNSRQNRN